MKSLDGGTWVDMFGAIVLIRLVLPLFHFPPLTYAEAGVWSTTIASFAYSNMGGGPKQS